jgi:phosphohistidine phosphatase
VYLYLVQHGEAKREEEDPSRGLTEKGSADVAQVAAYLQKMNINVSRILHSGKTRAMQTAQIIASSIKAEKRILESEGLAPMDEPGFWVKRLDGLNEDIMLVGHLPFLAKLSALILCGEQEKIGVDFKMGGVVCCRRFDDGRWAVEWMIVPEMVR